MPGGKCRVCLLKGSFVNIFQIRNSVSTSTKLMSLAKVQIYPNDGLPNTICFKCLKKLEKCVQFVKQCESSDRKLRLLLLEADHADFERTKSMDDDIKSNVFDSLQCSPNSETRTAITVTDSPANEAVIKDELKPIAEEVCIEDMKNKKQQCFKCGKVMSSRFRLKTHLRTHSGEKPFQCLICQKAFTLEQNLKVHMRIHTGEKPLQCNVCGASFAQSSGLVAHKRKHTGQTPYLCMLCPRSFRTWGHLQYHVKRHTGEKKFECDTCGRAFITQSDLKAHSRTHTGEKPHVCSTCGLKVARASHLKRHMESVHNGKNNFSCSNCSLQFSKKSEYEQHKKMHEDNKLDETD